MAAEAKVAARGAGTHPLAATKTPQQLETKLRVLHDDGTRAIADAIKILEGGKSEGLINKDGGFSLAATRRRKQVIDPSNVTRNAIQRYHRRA